MMILDRNMGLWGKLASGMIWRQRRPKDDAVGNVARFVKIDLQAPLDGQGDDLYLADAHDDIAKQRAAFSQHIGS